MQCECTNTSLLDEMFGQFKFNDVKLLAGGRDFQYSEAKVQILTACYMKQMIGLPPPGNMGPSSGVQIAN